MFLNSFQVFLPMLFVSDTWTMATLIYTFDHNSQAYAVIAPHGKIAITQAHAAHAAVASQTTQIILTDWKLSGNVRV